MCRLGTKLRESIDWNFFRKIRNLYPLHSKGFHIFSKTNQIKNLNLEKCLALEYKVEKHIISLICLKCDRLKNFSISFLKMITIWENRKKSLNFIHCHPHGRWYKLGTFIKSCITTLSRSFFFQVFPLCQYCYLLFDYKQLFFIYICWTFKMFFF